MRYLALFAGTLLVFLVLDGTWLVLVANGFFKSQLGVLLRAQPDLAAALVFYLIYTGGLLVLAVGPAAREGSANAAAARGGVLGLTAYATFDLTNLAIIQGWTLAVTLVDITWGTIVSAVTSLAGYHIARFTWPRGVEPAR
jgi:uncharacterized membrane protein